MEVLKVYVKAIGHGLGYNSYTKEFDFEITGNKDDEEDIERVNRYARIKAERLTACDHVTVKILKIEQVR